MTMILLHTANAKDRVARCVVAVLLPQLWHHIRLYWLSAGVHITADGLGVCRTKPYKLPNGVQRPIEHQVETAEPYVVRVPAALRYRVA